MTWKVKDISNQEQREITAEALFSPICTTLSACLMDGVHFPLQPIAKKSKKAKKKKHIKCYLGCATAGWILGLFFVTAG